MSSIIHELELHPLVMSESTPAAEIYEQHADMVYRAALRVTGNPADAEDVMQTVFLRVFSQRSQVDPARLPGGYFRRAAVNAALDVLRRRASHAEVPIDKAASQAGEESPVLLKERLRRALAAISQDDALVFLLRHVEGLSNSDLAALFGQEKNHIAVRLHRIRQVLQDHLSR